MPERGVAGGEEVVVDLDAEFEGEGEGFRFGAEGELGGL